MQQSNLPPAESVVRHRTMDLNGIRIFYREAGAADAPVLLLPHGYPSSSFHYRRLLPALADRWRLLAPDYPGFGYSDTPEFADFGYDFSAYAEFLEQFTLRLGVSRYALYLHDYGSQIGLRLALRAPERVAVLIIQNGDIYEDVLGPQYETIRRYWADPSAANRRVLENAVSEEGFRDEILGGIDESLRERVPPDTWKLHWSLMNTPVRRELAVRLMEGLKDNLRWFPRYQAYLREYRPPTLILWGPRDGYMPEASARAYLRDLPDAELHLLGDGGHCLLETHFDQVLGLTRAFLQRVYTG